MRWLRALCARMIFLLALLSGSPVLAHDLGLAQVFIDVANPPIYRLEAKLAPNVVAKPPRVPDRCRLKDQAIRFPTRVTQYAEWTIDCTGRQHQPTTGDIALGWKIEAALVTVRTDTENLRSTHLRTEQGEVRIPLKFLHAEKESDLTLFGRYFQFGAEHILSGLDHLAVIVCLCLMASGWRLVKLITGFTIGHSLTLALGLFGWVNLPSQPVEVLIALSVAFMAREALADEPSQEHGFWLVTGFGLLHGLGFAGALLEAGLAPNDLLLGLLAFNLGVEAGQVAFAAAVIGLIAALRVIGQETSSARQGTAFIVGVSAMFWTFDRLFSFVT